MTPVTPPGDGAAEAAVTFQAFADMIGKSRPYVSKLVAEGRITPRALTPDRKIIPALAREDMASGADPARGTTTARAAADNDQTYARQRARKTAADAELAELDLRQRRGELVERAAVATVLGPWLRELRDEILAVPRDTIVEPVLAAEVEAALATTLTRFSDRLTSYAENPNHGGAAAAG